MGPQYAFVLSSYPRFLNFPFKLSVMGCMPKNYHPVLDTQKRDGIYFGLYLKSYGGKVTWKDVTNGECYEVQAPCFSASGFGTISSLQASQAWEEIYLGYPPNLKEAFEQVGIKIDGRCRPLPMTRHIQHYLDELEKLCAFIGCKGTADRMDMVAFNLIMECHLPANDLGSAQDSNPKVLEIAEDIQQHLKERIDLDEIIRDYGFSRRQFYRTWNEVFHLPPARYILNRRLYLAKELLRSTTMKIYEVANECGFLNDMDFCRSFRKTMGVTPSQYRRECNAPAEGVQA